MPPQEEAQQQQQQDPHEHHRFVPCEASLQNDAPGWNEGTTAHQASSTDQKNRNDDDGNGPICWKCRNNNHNSKQQQQQHPTNSRKSKRPSICSVCHGKGRLPVSRRKKSRDAAQWKSMGEIKRARPNPPGFAPSGPMAAAFLLNSGGGGGESEAKEETNEQHHQRQQQINEWVQRIQNADAGQADYWVKEEDDNNSNNDHPLPSWLPRPGEQLVKLLGHWRILQKVGSHRWTTDDLVTAYVAAAQCVPECHAAQNHTLRYLDLGCGNGSVLQMVSWAILKYQQEQAQEQASSSFSFQGLGVEARSEAVALARRSLQFNLGDNNNQHNPVKVQHADFRAFIQAQQEEQGDAKKYDLITGTPPYFRVDFTTSRTTKTKKTTTATTENESSTQPQAESSKQQSPSSSSPSSSSSVKVHHAIIQQGGMPTSIQSAPARCEFRGGIEDYCLTAARVLAQGHGRFVVCNSFVNHERSRRAATAAGLEILSTLLVEGCRGRGILFVVYVMRLLAEGQDNEAKNNSDTTHSESQLTVREMSGSWTSDYVEKVFARMSIPGPIPKE